MFHLDAKINERNRLSSLRARFEKHGQRQITASMADDFKRREEIRRQHLESALAAMKPTPLTRTAEEIVELRARLERLRQEAKARAAVND
jgi:hypothetical protein